MGNWRYRGALALSGLLLACSSLSVCAEEITPAGYHVYDVQESEVSDTWYGISRGRFLQAGLTKVAEGTTNHVVCDGYTMAHFDCDRVYLRIYLDQSDDGETMWHTLDYWTDIAENASVATTESGPYRITKNKYYRVTGVHSVTKGGDTETTGTCTDALHID